ncbi:MAG: hypothetical protein A1D16_14015 [Flavihumibacter sp. CACIAM 22H1]|nr:MAG: hypothetical protein A1D16_14015 [Flavihumibacter sp. CACIAM 22H1]
MNEHSTLTDWLRYQAITVWDRIAFCRRQPHTQVFETTLTQNLVFQFYQLGKRARLGVTVYESAHERRNGNDLELVFEVDNRWLHVPCQCKILHQHNRYGGINHQVQGQLQLDLLLEYATRTGGLPVYLLYNHYSDPTFNESLSEHWKIPIEEFGCSFISARYLKEQLFIDGRIKAPSFSDLHRPHDQSALPFSALTTLLTQNGIHQFIHRYQTNTHPTDTPPAVFLRNELDIDGWDRLLRPAAIGRIVPLRGPTPILSLSGISTSFAPRYRLVFSAEMKERVLYRIE